jgi:hypothetical protein
MRKIRLLAATALLAALGCGGQDEPSAAVPLEKLPPGALDLARKQLPDLNFDSARKAKYKGQDAIEIRGKNKEGKIREVEVDLTGKLLEVERDALFLSPLDRYWVRRI